VNAGNLKRAGSLQADMTNCYRYRARHILLDWPVSGIRGYLLD